MIWSLVGFPLGLGIGNFIGMLYVLKSNETKHQTIKFNEMTSALWFILAVLIYGVFK